MDFMAQRHDGRPDRPHAARSRWRSCSGATPASRLSIFGSGLAAAGIAGTGTPEQIFEWVPQCYGDADDVKLGAFCVSEPDAGSDVSSLRTRAVYDEAKDEWVLNGTKAWITNGGIANVHVVVATVDPELKGRGQASFIVPPGHRRACRRARSTRSTASAPRTPPRSCSTTCASPAAACSAARRSSTPSWPRPASRQKTGEKQPAMATFEATRPAVGRHGRRHRPRRLRVRPRLRQGAPGVRQADHHEPGDRVHARRHGHRDRRRPPARVAGRVAGPQRRLHQRRGLDVASSRPAAPPRGSPSAPSRSSAATATSASTPSSASTATPRSWTSSRAPSRSSSS